MFDLQYVYVLCRLLIRFVKIEGLAPKGSNRARYNCVLKLTLLPHEKHIKFSKSIPAHSTLDIDESFVFTIKDPTKKVLRLIRRNPSKT